MSGEKILLTLMAFLLPPLPVFLLQKSIFTKEFLVCVILTLLGHLPGTLFALYFLFFGQDSRQDYSRIDEESSGNGGSHVSQSEPSAPQAINSTPTQRYTDQEPEAPQQANASAHATPVEGSSDAPPPTYDEAVPKEQQLRQSEIDSKRSGDNKVQR